jgi:hypothetical protein
MRDTAYAKAAELRELRKTLHSWWGAQETVNPASASIIEHFSSIPDPRIDRRKRHKLSDIFFITLCASICSANDWVAVKLFGKAKEEWFTELLGLENGIPSHDTVGNIFAAIDTELFSECFSCWVADLTELVSIDSYLQ